MVACKTPKTMQRIQLKYNLQRAVSEKLKQQQKHMLTYWRVHNYNNNYGNNNNKNAAKEKQS